MPIEREITVPVDLCLASGRLNLDAVGWTRTPLHSANLRGWGRTKRWDYWGIVTPSHILGLVASSLDYAGVHGIYLLDRETGREWVQDVVAPLARGTSLPDRCGIGGVRARAKDLDLTFDQQASHTALRVRGREVDADLSVGTGEHESMGVVVPWTERLFQYTVKDVGRPVNGTISVAGTTYEVGESAFAVLDHGRGRWPYRIRWNWAAGSDAAGNAVQLGGRWTVGTGSTENAIIVGGRVHQIGTEVAWHYDTDDWMNPWRITGPGVNVGFTPFHVRRARTELGIVGSDTHQAFGHFTGHVTADDGTVLEVDGFVGWAEEARQRW